MSIESVPVPYSYLNPPDNEAFEQAHDHWDRDCLTPCLIEADALFKQIDFDEADPTLAGIEGEEADKIASAIGGLYDGLWIIGSLQFAHANHATSELSAAIAHLEEAVAALEWMDEYSRVSQAWVGYHLRRVFGPNDRNLDGYDWCYLVSRVERIIGAAEEARVEAHVLLGGHY